MITACYCDDCADMMLDCFIAQRLGNVARCIMDAIEKLDVETNGVMDDDNDVYSERMDDDDEAGS